jgi:hypothetical protein
MKSWNSAGLWAKAKHFSDIANESEQSSANFALYCSLSLECLARAALTKIHPALNADPREDVNVLYAFGFELTAKPRSLPAHSVYLRVEKVVEQFQKPHRELCEFLALLRNAHLHSADLPFENLAPNKWLPRYYDTVKVLNEELGRNLKEFIGIEGASEAEELIKSLNDDVLNNVKSKCAAHAKVWADKDDEERTKLGQEAKSAAALLDWGQVTRSCPACGCDGVLTGTKVKEFPERYEDEELLMDVQFLASEYRCVACGLSLKGAQQIAHTQLDMHFTDTQATSLHALYEPEHYLEYDNM